MAESGNHDFSRQYPQELGKIQRRNHKRILNHTPLHIALQRRERRRAKRGRKKKQAHTPRKKKEKNH